MRKTGALEALRALERADEFARENRKKQEALQRSEKEREESRKFDEKHGLVGASVSERIRYVQEKILKTPQGHLLSSVAPQGRGLGAAPKKAPPKTHGHQQCSLCRETCVQMYDEQEYKTNKSLTWIDRVKCIKCGLEQPLRKEET